MEFTTKQSRNYAVLRLESADMGWKVQEMNAYDELRLKTKMQNGNRLEQNLTKKALETNQIA